jgi:hypothetical protein
MRRIVVVMAVLGALAAAVPAQASVRLIHRPVGSPGSYATLTAAVTPRGVTCSIVVHYLSGPSRAQGLYPKRATSRVSWVWKIGTRTTPGRWPVVVSCGRAGTLRTSIRVY